MFVSSTQIRVRYGETDQMGFVYYGNYPLYFEVGRAEAMRQIGMTYKQMEEMGVYMPIAKMAIKYFRPGRYDDLLTIKTIINDLPSARMNFDYEVYNEQGTMLCAGNTELAFINSQTNRPCRAPDWFLKKMEEVFNS
jgi:acyl-CoA thioester hydrolase